MGGLFRYRHRSPLSEARVSRPPIQGGKRCRLHVVLAPVLRAAAGALALSSPGMVCRIRAFAAEILPIVREIQASGVQQPPC
jgi:hypothetical protein